MRAVRARAVVTVEELRVHNVLATRRISWADIDAVEERSFFNVWALWHPIWYGTVVRVRQRRRPVGVLAAWHPDEERAATLRRQIRPPAPEPETRPSRR